MRKRITGNVSWVGYMDWELLKFHGDEYSVSNGSSQNSYIVEEGKTVLFDTVWAPHKDWFVNNLKKELGDLNKIDYIIVQHGEKDHSGSLPALMREIPNTPIYCTEECVKSIEGQYGKNGWDFHVIHTGDTLDIGNGKQLVFVEMKMLHWPDAMATYMTGDNVLFSMDAFGQHYALEEMWNDLADQDLLYKEAMKYFVNIVGPYRSFVGPKIEEVLSLNLQIDYICPSHGVIWRDNPAQIVETYAKWGDAGYKEDQITIAYDTMWDGTKKLAHAIAKEINRQSPKTRVKIYNIAKTDKNDIMTEVFRSRAIAVGSPTCVNDILSSVSGWLTFLKSLKFSQKKAAAFGCYGWTGESVGILQERLLDAGFDVVNENVKSFWNPEDDDYAKIPALVSALLSDEAGDFVPGAGDMTVIGNEPGKRVFKCNVCGWEYSELDGCPAQGIGPGTKWEDLPTNFHCEVCKVPKDQFTEVGGAPVAAAPASNEPANKVWKCGVCGATYDEAAGLPDKGIAPGTRLADLPADCKCGFCGVPKSVFVEVGTNGAAPAASGASADVATHVVNNVVDAFKTAAAGNDEAMASGINELMSLLNQIDSIK